MSKCGVKPEEYCYRADFRLVGHGVVQLWLMAADNSDARAQADSMCRGGTTLVGLSRSVIGRGPMLSEELIPQAIPEIVDGDVVVRTARSVKGGQRNEAVITAVERDGVVIWRAV